MVPRVGPFPYDRTMRALDGAAAPLFRGGLAILSLTAALAAVMAITPSPWSWLLPVAWVGFMLGGTAAVLGLCLGWRQSPRELPHDSAGLPSSTSIKGTKLKVKLGHVDSSADVVVDGDRSKISIDKLKHRPRSK